MLRNLPFAPIVGAMFGLVAAILVIATPQFLFERMVLESGLPSLVSAAAPPLGEKARVMTALIAAALVGAALFAVLRALENAKARRKPLGRGVRIGAASVGTGLVRTLAEPPRPIFAGSDLGAPFMSDEAMTVAREELLLESDLAETPPASPATINGLLDRLEDALAVRSQRVGRIPPVPGDIASLRAALGMELAA